MKKSFFIACCFFLAAFAANAQRYAVIDSKFILEKIPEYKDAQSRLDQFTPYPYETPDMYNWMLGIGSAGKGLGDRLDKRHEMWSIIVDNPDYGPYWQEVAADQWFEKPPRLVPALHVHGFWDQEDIYGAPAVYAATEKFDTPIALINLFSNC